MTSDKVVACIIGTRPEAIKMAPVISAMKESSAFRCVVVTTGQHRELLNQMLEKLDIQPDHHLDLMTEGQGLSDLFARMLPGLETVFAKERVDVVLAQGDTATTFCAALAAFHRKIPFGHIEAGLRTNDLLNPFPEEGYRQMISRISRWNFAPTDSAADNLISEGISPDRIHVTGNTGIDSLLKYATKLPAKSLPGKRIILLTAHRRENFGEPIKAIFRAVKRIVEHFDDVEVVYPVHPNPSVRELAKDMLGNHPRISLLAPLDYFQFIDAMKESTVILTDSGGVQEEAPALGKPVLILRDTTERMESVNQGHAIIVGTNESFIYHEACNLLTDHEKLSRMSKLGFLYGDGKAAIRMVFELEKFFQ